MIYSTSHPTLAFFVIVKRRVFSMISLFLHFIFHLTPTTPHIAVVEEDGTKKG